MSADERRAAIIESVLPLLAQHGGAVTARQIAEAAGIAEGTIFRVFGDLRSLFLAVAEETMNPPAAREELAVQLAPIPDLRSKVVYVVERLVARMEQGMLVMMALRSVLMSEGRSGDDQQPSGPPRFVVEANRQLTQDLTDLLFLPHAGELRVSPDRAALVVRSLVFGAWHPGMPHGETHLSADEVADVILGGIARPAPSDPTCSTQGPT